MQILPIDPSFQRVILQGNRSPEGLQLTLGQQIAATVLKINEEGQLLLGFGAQKVWARSEYPLTEGQQLQLRVNQNGATVELQLLDTTTDSIVENFDMATLLQSRQRRNCGGRGRRNPASGRATATVQIRQPAFDGASEPPVEIAVGAAYRGLGRQDPASTDQEPD